MGEHHFLILLVLAHCLVFRPPGRVSFMKAFLASTLRVSLRLFKSVPCEFVFGQRKGSKRKATLPCWPSASLRASSYSGRCGTRCAQTVLALIRSKPAVLDNTKGAVRSKTGQNLLGDNSYVCRNVLTAQPSYRCRPVSRITPSLCFFVIASEAWQYQY